MARASESARWLGVVVERNDAGQGRELAVGRVVAGDHPAGQLGGVDAPRTAATRGPAARRSGGGSRRRTARCGRPGRCRPRTRGTPAAPSRSDGASTTIELLMPVSTAMNGGISVCGLTSVWNSPSTSPPRTLTAPISVIIDPASAEPPVVSRSTTVNVTSRSGRPSSSKLRWHSQRAVSGAADAPVLMVATVGPVADIARHPRRPGLLGCGRGRDPARPAGRRQPVALRGLRQPHPVRRAAHPPDRGVLALRPGRRARGRGDRGAGRDRRVGHLPVVRAVGRHRDGPSRSLAPPWAERRRRSAAADIQTAGCSRTSTTSRRRRTARRSRSRTGRAGSPASSSLLLGRQLGLGDLLAVRGDDPAAADDPDLLGHVGEELVVGRQGLADQVEDVGEELRRAGQRELARGSCPSLDQMNMGVSRWPSPGLARKTSSVRTPG